MSAPLDISTREKLIECCEWIIENNLVLCRHGMRQFTQRVIEELAKTKETPVAH